MGGDVCRRKRTTKSLVAGGAKVTPSNVDLVLRRILRRGVGKYVEFD